MLETVGQLMSNSHSIKAGMSTLLFSFSDNLPKGLSKATHTMTLHRLICNSLTYKRLHVFFENSVSGLTFMKGCTS